jgi:hypothetical protein
VGLPPCCTSIHVPERVVVENMNHRLVLPILTGFLMAVAQLTQASPANAAEAGNEWNITDASNFSWQSISYGNGIDEVRSLRTSAATVQDQSNLGPSTSRVGARGDRQVAQIFTAGISGHLTKIALNGCDIDNDLVSVNIRIYNAVSTPQNATPPVLPAPFIGETNISGAGLSIIPDSSRCPAWFDVVLDQPAPVIAGNIYAFVVSATKTGVNPNIGGLRLMQSGLATYTSGNQATKFDADASWSTSGNYNILFITYVDPSIPTPTPASKPQTFELTLATEDGSTCSNSSQIATAGTWVTLPGDNDCSPPASKAGATLLGWATSPNFPVSIAQRQIDNGWGAYETFNDDGQLTGVFIPAGGATFVSASGELYAIWSE